jgi:luciferase family oxidoreductase group 1
MLPNHAPLIVAEQFGTLASLYPGRIDLGIGRAPGADQVTMRAMRRDALAGVDDFPGDLLELQQYFAPAGSAPVRAVPGEGLDVPIWLLGSSTYSAQLAARRGLPFAFASHFAPDHLMTALDTYRARFVPGAIPRPYAMAVVNVFASDTDADGRRMFTSLQLAFINLRRGQPGPLAPPVDEVESRWSPMERLTVDHALQYSFVGSADTVRRGLERFIDATGVDELMITGQIHDHEARKRSFAIAASVSIRHVRSSRRREPTSS